MIKKHRFFVLLIVFFTACMIAQNVFAIDILEVRIKRLYQEAEMLAAKGDYDAAIEIYNKAIGYAKDKDIKQFLVNARKEAQRGRRASHGTIKMFSSKEGLEGRIFDSGIPEGMPKPKSMEEKTTAVKPEESEEEAALEEEKAMLKADKEKLEEEKAGLERERRKKEIERKKAKLEQERAEFDAEKKRFEEERAKLEAEETASVKEGLDGGMEEKTTAVKPEESEEEAALEEEKARLKADKEKLEEEKAGLERERRKKEIEEKKAELEREKAEFDAEKKKLEEERAKLEAEKAEAVKENRKAAAAEAEEIPPAVKEPDIEKDEEQADANLVADADLADIEERKEREARDRAIYENSDYRYKVKEVLAGALKRMREAVSKIEETELRERIEAKINKLAALDRQAEEFMSQGQYEKARGIYEKIMEMSKDIDLKEYLKK